MKITLLTYGSRGDLQPFVALAGALHGRGHEVRLAGPHRFTEFAAEHGVPYIPLAGDPEEISRRINDAGADTVRMVRGMKDYIFSIAEDVMRSAFAACADADLIIHSFLFTTGGHSLARQMGIPDISAQLFPVFLPTTEFPNVLAPNVPSGPLSVLTHWLVTQVFWVGGNSGYARFRRQSPEIFPQNLFWPFKESPGRPRTPYLGAWSPAVIPFPHDWPIGDAHITGYWFLDSPGYQPSSELADFLAAGEKPVCVTFGSMIHRKAGRIGREVLAALDRAGERALVLTGWDNWEIDPPKGTLFIQAAPHDWLFPRCKLVLHHGGAGTSAAVVRAGVPGVVVPFAGDQLFWAKRLHSLQVTSAPLRIERLLGGGLDAALREALSGEMGENAARLGERVRSEDGLGRAVDLIEAHAENFKVPRPCQKGDKR